MEISDLDSLELVKFYLEIESKFAIEVKEADIYKLKTIEAIVDYITYEVKEDTVDKDDDVTLNDRDLLSIEYALSNPFHLKYNKEVIESTPTQKRLFTNNQFRTIYFDVNLKRIDCEELLSLNSTIELLSDKIDIFRMVILKTDNKLQFRVIDTADYTPNIILLDKFPKNSALNDLVNSKDCIPIPIIIVSTHYKTARFYFPYHSIDSSSLNKLENIVYKVYENKSYITFVKDSSLYQFEQYKKDSLCLDLTPDVLNNLPEIKNNIDFSSFSDDVQIFELPVDMDSSKEDNYLYTVYAICRCLLMDYDISSISGGLSYDFREFVNFDGENLIGDVHKKMPFEVKVDEDYQNFRLCFSKLLNLYAEGVDFSEIASRRDDSIGQLVKERLSELSLSINYIGEALNVSTLIKEVIANKFEKNFINIFTHKGKSYSIICSNLFKNKIYEIEINNNKIVTNVSNEIL